MPCVYIHDCYEPNYTTPLTDTGNGSKYIRCQMPGTLLIAVLFCAKKHNNSNLTRGRVPWCSSSDLQRCRSSSLPVVEEGCADTSPTSSGKRSSMGERGTGATSSALPTTSDIYYVGVRGQNRREVGLWGREGHGVLRLS